MREINASYLKTEDIEEYLDLIFNYGYLMDGETCSLNNYVRLVRACNFSDESLKLLDYRLDDCELYKDKSSDIDEARRMLNYQRELKAK